MKGFAGVLLSAELAFSTWAAQPLERIPQFREYPAKVLQIRPVTPRFSRNHESFLREGLLSVYGAVSEPNFAGRFVVARWPCGTECEQVAVVDARTGRVYPPPLERREFPFGLPIASTDYADPEYRSDSRLFIVRHGCPRGLEKPCYDFFFVWENDHFELIKQIRVPVPARVYLAPEVHTKSR